ncbi:MAG: MBL fold metallo-hydrolase [Caulobacterales bacterium]
MDQPQSPPIRAVIAPVTPLQQNCTIVWCAKTKKAAVIDPGGEVPRLLQILADQGLTLEKIWVTHGHLDHAGGTAALKEATGVPIEGPHPADQFWIDDIGKNAARWGMADARVFTPDRWLEDGDRVTLGETEWEVYHCPGHTPGHVIFFNREARFAQVGDVLFAGSIGRTDFPRGSFPDLISSITQKLWPLGDDVVFVPGHNQISTFGDERRTNPFVSDEALAAMRV